MDIIENLSERQKAKLLKYMKVMSYSNKVFTFGPKPNKYFKDIRDIFNLINVGFHGRTIQPSEYQKEKLVELYVDFIQADKLIIVLSDLTGQSSQEIADENYHPPKTNPYQAEQLMRQIIHQREIELTSTKRKKKRKKKTSEE